MPDGSQQPVLDENAVAKFGLQLNSKFLQYERDRKLAELKWARNYRQKLGIYDPDVDQQLDPLRSRAYPKLTRVKCVSMLSRIMNLIFQNTDKAWSVVPSPVPNLSMEDMQALLQQVQQQAQQNGAQPSDEEIEAAIYKLAEKRAERLEREIEDQLTELGGNRQLNYVALCRKVLQSGIDYGLGVLEGPFADDQVQRKWRRDPNGMLLPQTVTVQRPRFDFISIWDYYPDMSARIFAQMDGQFTRKVVSRHQLSMLKRRKDFIAKQIDKALAKFTGGNYKRRPYETELKAMGVQLNVTEAERGKFEIIAWHGNVPATDLMLAGATVPQERQGETVRASVWFVDDIVIKAQVDPWLVIAGDKAPPMFHHFVFEEDDSTLVGNGMPNIVRDSQMSLCATTRMALDNASIACGLNLEVNTELLSMNQDITAIQPNKIWYREDANPATMQYPIVRPVEIPSRVQELQGLGTMFLGFADQETFIGPATGGDMSKMPSEPMRTLTGASMLRGDAALPFKDVVRNFDVFTESVIGSLIIFNKELNKNPALRGDFQAMAKGATSLVAKEVLGMQLDSLAQSLTDEEKMYLDMHEFARARIRTRDLPIDGLVVDDAEAQRREQAEQQKRDLDDQMRQRTIEAEIRVQLSTVLKNLAQAGKSAAGAQATTANTILAGMEKGMSPNALAHAVAGTGAGGADSSAGGGAGGLGDEGAGAAEAVGGDGAVPADASVATGTPAGAVQSARGAVAPPRS